MDTLSDDDFSKVADPQKRDLMKEHCKIQFSVKALFTMEPQEIRVSSLSVRNADTEYFRYEIKTFKGEEFLFEKRYGEFEAFHQELIRTVSDPNRQSPYGSSLHTLPVLPEKQIDKKVKSNIDARQEDLRIYTLQVLLHRGLSALELSHKFFFGNSGPKAPGFFWRAVGGIGRAVSNVTGIVKGVIGGSTSTNSSNQVELTNLAKVSKIVEDQTNTINFLKSTLELFEGKQELYFIVEDGLIPDQNTQTSFHVAFDPYMQHLNNLRGGIKHLETIRKQFLALEQSYQLYEDAKYRCKVEKQKDENQHAAAALLNKDVSTLKSFLRHSRLVLKEEFEIINDQTKRDLHYIMQVVTETLSQLNKIGNTPN